MVRDSGPSRSVGAGNASPRPAATSRTQDDRSGRAPARPEQPSTPPVVIPGASGKAPKIVKMPKIVTSAKPPADAKLELVEPPPTIDRAKGGHGVASRSLKRSSKGNQVALKRSGSHKASGESSLEGSGKRKTSGRDRGALARKARGGGLPVGVIVAIPIVLVFGIGLMLLAGGSSPPPATTSPAATPATSDLPRPIAPPSTSSPSAPASDGDQADAPREQPASAPSTRDQEEADAKAEAEHAERLRQLSREAIEAERRMIEEREGRAGDAPAPAADEPAADEAAIDGAVGE